MGKFMPSFSKDKITRCIITRKK